MPLCTPTFTPHFRRTQTAALSLLLMLRPWPNCGAWAAMPSVAVFLTCSLRPDDVGLAVSAKRRCWLNHAEAIEAKCHVSYLFVPSASSDESVLTRVCYSKSKYNSQSAHAILLRFGRGQAQKIVVTSFAISNIFDSSPRSGIEAGQCDAAPPFRRSIARNGPKGRNAPTLEVRRRSLSLNR
jgi:hypothetical protein